MQGTNPTVVYLVMQGLPRKIRESPVLGTNPIVVDHVVTGLPREIRMSSVLGTSPMGVLLVARPGRTRPEAVKLLGFGG